MNNHLGLGGYFELELRNGKEYHTRAIALNTARNALEMILLNRNYKKVWLPYFFCDVLLQALYVTKTPYDFYYIDKELSPCLDFPIADDEGILVINYFGLKTRAIKKLVSERKNIIVDNAQAFFVCPQGNEDTIYSCRKFFGVPDGAYLYINTWKGDIELSRDVSGERLSSLVGRIETGVEENYEGYKRNEYSLNYQSAKLMSNLTRALMKNVDYDECERKRTVNFAYLNKNLKHINELNLDFMSSHGAFAYPFLLHDDSLRQKFIDRKIFVPLFWNNVLALESYYWEYHLAKYLLPLPIDQRYDEKDMDRILEVIL